MADQILENKGSEESRYATEQQLLKIVDNMLEGVQIIGFDWKYIYVNGAMTRHGKYSKEEFIGYTVMEKYPGIEQTEVYKVYQRCFDERIPIQMENRFVFPDRSVAWFELSFQPVPEGIFILSIDITERKVNEEKIAKLNEELEQRVAERTAELENNIQQVHDNKQKFQKAFQLNTAGMAITSLDNMEYVEVNDSFSKMVGYSKEELIGHTSTELGLVAEFDKREEILKQVKEKGYTKNIEVTMKNRKGELLTILSSIESLELHGEKYALNIIYDITERKRAEEELESANKELEAFSYTVSHDLRAPLRAVDGYAKILEEEYADKIDAQGQRFLGRIQYNARRMSHLIDDLLAFSKLGRKTVTKRELDMDDLVLGVLNRMDKNNAQVNMGSLLTAPADTALLEQVWTNLLSNALKYSSKKADPIVSISSEDRNGMIVYSIKDNGVGFDMKYVDKLFGVFNRLHTSEEFEGTGVGLAIVNRIILKHGGKVWVDAELDRGATFSFSLPK